MYTNVHNILLPILAHHYSCCVCKVTNSAYHNSPYHSKIQKLVLGFGTFAKPIKDITVAFFTMFFKDYLFKKKKKIKYLKVLWTVFFLFFFNYFNFHSRS